MRWLTVLALVAALLGGCGDDDKPEASGSEASAAPGEARSAAATASSATTNPIGDDDQAYVDATLAANGAFGDLAAAVGDTGVRCYVNATIDAFGIEDLQGAGITPETFATDAPDHLPVKISDTKVPQLRTDLQACFDPIEFVIGFFAAPADCVRPQLDGELALSAAVDLARGTDDESAGSPLGQVFAILDGCGPPPASDE